MQFLDKESRHAKAHAIMLKQATNTPNGYCPELRCWQQSLCILDSALAAWLFAARSCCCACMQVQGSMQHILPITCILPIPLVPEALWLSPLLASAAGTTSVPPSGSPVALADLTEADSGAIATCFFFGPSATAAIAAVTPGCAAVAVEAVAVEAPVTAVLTVGALRTAAVLPAGAELTPGRDSTAASGAAVWVLRGVFLGVAAPWDRLRGEGTGLG